MKKTLMTAFTSVMLLTGATSSFAHTHLSSTNPQDGQVMTTDLTDITLTFDGPIEEGGSINLTTGNETIAVENITAADMVMTGTVAEPLANGDYTATWVSISADGHPVEGEFTFKVNVPAVEETPVTETDVETEVETTVETEETATTSVEAEQEPAEESSNTLLFVIGGLIVIIAISSLVLFKRKK